MTQYNKTTCPQACARVGAHKSKAKMKQIATCLIAGCAVFSSFADQLSVFKPEAIVQFPSSNIACASRDDLGEVMEHLFKGENTKANAMMFSPKNQEGACIMLFPKKKYKVISVMYNDPAHPDMGLLEIIGADNQSGHGFWALSMMARPAK